MRQVSVLGVVEKGTVADLRRTLHDAGYEVLAVVHTGDDAVAVAEEQAPDVALVDLDLTGTMDGHETAEHLSCDLDISIVGLTSSPQPDLLDRHRDTVPLALIVKPFHEGQLLATMVRARHYLERSRGQAPIAGRASDATFQAIFEEAPIGIATVDTEGRLLATNAALQEMLGYSRDALQGTDIATLTHPDDTAKDLERYDELIAGERDAYHITKRYLRAGGDVMWGQLAVSLVRDGSGAPAFAVGMVQDITEQVRAKRSARVAKRRYRQLFEQAPIMYVITRNRDGVPFVADCNQAFLTTLEYTREEVLGRPLADFYTGESGAKMLAGGGYAQALSGTFTPQERQLRTKDGRIVETLLQALPETDADGDIVGTRAMYVDITERKQAEERAKQLAEEHKQLLEMSQEMLSTLALDDVLERILQALGNVLDYDSCGLYWIDEDRGVLCPTVVIGTEWISEEVAHWEVPIDTGIIGSVVASGEGELVNNAHLDPRSTYPEDADVVREHLICLPLQKNGKLLGVCNLSRNADPPFTEDEFQLVQLFIAHVAIALENAQLYNAEQYRREELDTLYRISRDLVATDDVDRMLRSIVRHTANAVGTTFCRIVLLESDQYVCRATYAVRRLDRTLRVDRPEPEPACRYYRRAVRRNVPMILHRTDDDLTPTCRQALFLDIVKSVCLVPLRMGEIPIGVLVLGEARRPAREPFDDEKLRVLTSIAEQAANALYRAQLHKEVEESYLETVLALAKAVDARDAYTGDHSQRMAEWAVTTARALGCSEEQVESIRWGALLHDIGKIGVPDRILQKPGPLTDEEWEVMKRHPDIGADIVAPVKKLRDVRPIIRAHQEKYDGSGYPDGLRGDAIPVGARILAVVDAYSAITDDRPYRDARSHEEAVAELQRCAGTHFDPEVVVAFLRSVHVQEHATADELVHAETDAR